MDAVSVLVQALRDLIDHPFPHDLMNMRRRVNQEFGGDDTVAREEMSEWCSQEYCNNALDAWIGARTNAQRLVEEYLKPSNP